MVVALRFSRVAPTVVTPRATTHLSRHKVGHPSGGKMPPVVRNVLAVVLGLVVGSVANMALVVASGSVVPPPAGADVTTPEGLAASIHLFEPKHFVMPFLAHAAGTLVGAAAASRMAATRGPTPAAVVGGFFLLGGLANAAIPRSRRYGLRPWTSSSPTSRWRGWDGASGRRRAEGPFPDRHRLGGVGVPSADGRRPTNVEGTGGVGREPAIPGLRGGPRSSTSFSAARSDPHPLRSDPRHPRGHLGPSSSG